MSKSIGLEKIAKRYSEALFLLAADKKLDEEKILNDLAFVKEIFENSKELVMLLGHPSVEANAKKGILAKLFRSTVSAEVLSLLMILIEKRRLNIATVLFTHFRNLYLKKKNIEVAKLSSAKPLAEAELKEIKNKLEKIFTKKLEIETHLDESLIAGIKVNVGNKVLDSSIKSKLRQMKQLLNT